MLRKKEERKGSECDGDVDNGSNGVASSSSSAATAVSSSNGNSSNANNATPSSRRSWEQWSSEDKVPIDFQISRQKYTNSFTHLQATFFEALNEYGKNFDAIQSHFQSKAARNKRLLKDKEQIRDEQCSVVLL